MRKLEKSAQNRETLWALVTQFPDLVFGSRMVLPKDVKYLQNYLQNYLNPPIFEAGILAGSRYFPGIYQVFIRYSSAFWMTIR